MTHPSDKKNSPNMQTLQNANPTQLAKLMLLEAVKTIVYQDVNRNG
jgi:hypothetical protein